MKLPKLIKSRVERAEAELGALLKEAADLSERIAALADLERTSEDADEIHRVIGERIAANNRLAKLEIKIGTARQTVADAKVAQNEALRIKIFNDIEDKGLKFISVAKVCRAAFDDFEASRDALGANYFNNYLIAAPFFPNINGAPILAHELIEALAAQLDGLARRNVRTMQAVPVPPAAPPPELVPQSIPAAPEPEQEIAPAPAKPARERFCDPPAEGMVRIVFLRGGCEADGRQFTVGDVAAFPPDIANKLMETGAADLVQEGAQ